MGQVSRSNREKRQWEMSKGTPAQRSVVNTRADLTAERRKMKNKQGNDDDLQAAQQNFLSAVNKWKGRKEGKL